MMVSIPSGKLVGNFFSLVLVQNNLRVYDGTISRDSEVKVGFDIFTVSLWDMM
jgi:hypothetical protein